MALAQKQYTNFGRTQIANAGDLNNTTNPITLNVDDGSVFAAITTGQRVVISAATDPMNDSSREVAEITARTVNSITLSRPNAVAHSGKSYVFNAPLAADFTDLGAAITAVETSIAAKSPLIYDAIVSDETTLLAAIAAGYKRLYVKGTVTLTAALTISANNLVLGSTLGDGTLAMNNTSNRLTISGADVILDGLIITVTSTTSLAANTNGWIEWTGTRGVMRNNYINLSGVSTATTGNIIYASSADQWRFQNNYVNSGAKLRSIIFPGTNKQQIISGNQFNGFSDMSAIYFSSSSSLLGLTITDNQFTVSAMADSKHVVHLQSTGGAVTDIIFTSNEMICAGTQDGTNRNGLYIKGSTNSLSTANAITITGNTIRKTTNQPFDFGLTIDTLSYVSCNANTVGQIQFNGLAMFTINNNVCGTIYQNGSTSSVKGTINGNTVRQYMLLDYIQDCVIADNVADSGQGSLQMGSTSNCYQNIIANNNQFGGITIDGSYSTIIGNEGYGPSGVPQGTLVINGNHHFVQGNFHFSAVTMTATDTIYNEHYDLNTAAAVNGTTVETDLRTKTIAANMLYNNGDYLEIEAYGTYAANANTKQIKFYYNGVVILDTGALAINSGSFRLKARVYRSGSAAQKIVATFTTDNALLPTLTKVATGAHTMSSTAITKITGQSNTAGSDISLELWDVQLKRVS